MDFGIARFLPPGGRGTQIGSVGYAPPEQYLGKMEPRSDLYSLAATMHHLLTGRDPQLEPPFSFPLVRSLAPQVSLQTEQVVMAALDKNVEKRPSSARAMRDLLPDPSAEEAGIVGTSSTSSGGISTSRSGVAPMAAMATIVLNRPVSTPSAPPSPSAVTPAPPLKLGAGAQLETQRSLRLPLASSASSPAPISQPPRKQPIPPAPPPNRSVAKPQVSSVSSTAKTQDLGLKPARPAPSSPPARAATAPKPPSNASTSPRRASPITVPDPRPGPNVSAELSRPRSPIAPSVHPALQPGPAQTPSRNGHATYAPNATIGARLEALAEGARFSLDAGRVIIGRSLDPTDAIDIDLRASSVASIACRAVMPRSFAAAPITSFATSAVSTALISPAAAASDATSFIN